MTSKGSFMTVMQIWLFAFLPYALFTGSAFDWALSVFMYAIYAGVGTVVTMHRLLAHRSFESNIAFRWFGAFMGTVGSLLTPLEWVQQHIDHHRYTDTEKDPHSPAKLGWRAMFFCNHSQGTGKFAATRLAKEPFMRTLHERFYLILGMYIAVLAFLGGWQLVTFAWAIPCLMSLWGQILIVFAHGKGGPKTLGWLTGLITFGEHNHAHHHNNPRDLSRDGIARWFINLVRTDAKC